MSGLTRGLDATYAYGEPFSLAHSFGIGRFSHNAQWSAQLEIASQLPKGCCATVM